MTTFADVLQRRLRSRPGDPLLTFYDHRSGERTELSVTTYATWVAKAAGLMAEELELGRGDRLLVDLPTHWLGPVALGGAWAAGLEIVWEGPAEAVWCGPDTLQTWAPRAAELPVLASSLAPLGGRFPDGVPAGVHDIGVEIWSLPDAFTPWDPPVPDDRAVTGIDHRALWEEAATTALVPVGGRLMSTLNPASPGGLTGFTGPLARGGSLVLVAHADPGRLAATYDGERASARIPPGTPGG